MKVLLRTFVFYKRAIGFRWWRHWGEGCCGEKYGTAIYWQGFQDPGLFGIHYNMDSIQIGFWWTVEFGMAAVRDDVFTSQAVRDAINARQQTKDSYYERV